MALVVEDKMTRSFDVTSHNPEALAASSTESLPAPAHSPEAEVKSVRFNVAVSIEPDQTLRVTLLTRDADLIARAGGSSRTVVFDRGSDGVYSFNRVE